MTRFKTHQEIADEYGIHRTTLYRWLRKDRLSIPKGLLSPKCQEMIYTQYGRPVNSSLRR